MEVVMKKLLTVAAGLIASTTMLMTAAPAMARTDLHVQVQSPAGYGAQRIDYAQSRPVYEDHHRQQAQPQRSFHEHGRYNEHGRPMYRDRDDYRGRAIHYQRRDSDRDGVPDRFDARPHNSYRY
jgi:hypothetical protein